MLIQSKLATQLLGHPSFPLSLEPPSKKSGKYLGSSQNHEGCIALTPFSNHGLGFDRATDKPEGIQPEDLEVIFGRDFKLEAADPNLFYIYEFRKCSLDAKLIVAVRYRFGDGHINKIFSQALSDVEAR